MSAPFTVIIPARYASTRLPGKPLLDIAGKPMIQRVYEQACLSAAERVIIATDDQRIADCCQGFGAEVCLTSADHPSGTDRLQEVVTRLRLADDTVVVNVQGDEPLLPAATIDQVASNVQAHNVMMATLSEPIVDVRDVFDRNVVKVVSNQQGIALYFSRAAIPWSRASYGHTTVPDTLPSQVLPSETLSSQTLSSETPPLATLVQRHVGIYAYRVSLLNQFVQWGACALEHIEALEQLRAMWHGVAIHVAPCVETPPHGVDTEQDLQKVRDHFQGAV